MLRRVLRSTGALPRRDAWHNLAAYTLNEKNATAWRDLRNRDIKVEGTIQRFTQPTQDQIDWSHWENLINHKPLVNSLKDFHQQQISLLQKYADEDHKQFIESQTQGWDLFDDAVKSCEKSVAKSEEIMANGARALWITYKNPRVWDIDSNEWVDSDQYWQSYLEKHHYRWQFMFQQDPETDEFDKSFTDQFMKINSKYNDRSDMPLNFIYMAQLPSTEYYSVFKRSFLEHMLYHLAKTGGDARFFPELPPWQWLTHIEELRWKYLSVTQRRRSAQQLAEVAREKALDMLPVDVDHHGEHAAEELIQEETENLELAAARLMGNFILFSDPYVPIQTQTALQRAINLDDGRGKFFSLGEDVNAVFYKAENVSLPRPKEGFHRLLDHLTLTGRRLNVGYAAMLDIFTDLLESRGEHWLTAPGENVADAFMRRLKEDDANYHIYQAYVDELKERWRNAKEIPHTEIVKRVQHVEQRYKLEQEVYELLLNSRSHTVQTSARANLEKITKLQEAGNLAGNLTSGQIVVVNDNQLATKDVPTPSKMATAVVDAKQVLSFLADFEEDKERIVDAIDGQKIPQLESRKK